MPDPDPRDRPAFLRPAIWMTYALLFGIAIPWYWSGDDVRRVLGIPLWAAVSIAASAVIAVYTAWLLMNHWPEEEDES